MEWLSVTESLFLFNQIAIKETEGFPESANGHSKRKGIKKLPGLSVPVKPDQKS